MTFFMTRWSGIVIRSKAAATTRNAPGKVSRVILYSFCQANLIREAARDENNANTEYILPISSPDTAKLNKYLNTPIFGSNF